MPNLPRRAGRMPLLEQVWRCGGDALPLLPGVKLGAVAESLNRAETPRPQPVLATTVQLCDAGLTTA